MAELSFAGRVAIVTGAGSGLGRAYALELARRVMEHAESRPFEPMYQASDLPVAKINAVARAIYGADGVVLTPRARRDLARVRRLGLTHLPVCLAKTQSSLSDDPTQRGRPSGFEVTVRGVQVSAGAGFLVVLLGDIMRMPGLPRRPSALDVDVVDGEVVGIAD